MPYTLSAGVNFYEWTLVTSDSFATVLSAGYLNADQAVLDVNEVIECRLQLGNEVEYRLIYVTESTAAGGVVVESEEKEYVEHGLADVRVDASENLTDVAELKSDVSILLSGITPPASIVSKY